MDINSLIEGIEKLLDYMFGGNTPVWLLPTISWIVGVGLILAGLVSLLGVIKKLWVDFVQPAFYKPEDVRRRFRRQMFADYLESEVRRLNNLEAWNDNRFTELEAEIAAEGSKKLLGWIPFSFYQGSGLRHEKSLSVAIEKSSERLVLLEGDPGAGKSVALRHVAKSMAEKARKSRNLKTRIPIYVNLKYLQRGLNELVDRNLIQNFIFTTLNRINDRDIDEYLHSEFSKGMQDGTWFFLFDSFDEIPEVLSSTGADDIVRQYAEAISDFLHGMNQCQGIVASREYRGPKALGWPRFRILPLSFSRRIKLVRQTRLPFPVQKGVNEGLVVATDDFKLMASNPMFLNLICEYMNKKEVPEFPSHIHHVFEEYIKLRLSHDTDRLNQRFKKRPEEIRLAAEKMAFCMTADGNLGLSPSLDVLNQSTLNLGLSLGTDFNLFVEALEYLKLARIDLSIMSGKKTFSFAHRRFQEYFATAVVLREPERLSSIELLTNGRWRETAIVILQTQNEQRIKHLSEIAFETAKSLVEQLEQPVSVPEDLSSEAAHQLPKYIPLSLFRSTFESFDVSRQKIADYIQKAIRVFESNSKNTPVHKPIQWPAGLFHLFSILQEGAVGKRNFITAEFQDLIDKTLFVLTETGDIVDKKLCLDVAGISSPSNLINLIEKGVSRESSIIRQSAYRQIARLAEIPLAISNFIRINMIDTARAGNLFKNRDEFYVQLSRLPNPRQYLNALRLLIWAPGLDFILTVCGLLIVQEIVSPMAFVFIMLINLIAYWIRWKQAFNVRNISSVISINLALGAIVLLELFSLSISGIVSSATDSVSGLMTLEQVQQTAIISGRLLNWQYLAFLMLSSWGFFALLALRTGKGTFLFWWPVYGLIMPSASLITSFLNIATAIYASFMVPAFNILTIILRWLLFAALIISQLDWFYILPRMMFMYKLTPQEYRKFSIIMFLFYTQEWFLVLWGLPIAIIMALLSGLAWIMERIIPRISPDNPIYFPLLYITLGGLGIILIGIFSPIALSIFQEWKTLISWQKRNKSLSVIEMVTLSSSYKFNVIKLQMYRHIIKSQLILPTSENINHLRNLIAFISVILVCDNKDEQYVKLGDIDPVLAQHLQPQDWKSEQLDELCKLFDQIQVSTK